MQASFAIIVIALSAYLYVKLEPSSLGQGIVAFDDDSQLFNDFVSDFTGDWPLRLILGIVAGAIGVLSASLGVFSLFRKGVMTRLAVVSDCLAFAFVLATAIVSTRSMRTVLTWQVVLVDYVKDAKDDSRPCVQWILLGGALPSCVGFYADIVFLYLEVLCTAAAIGAAAWLSRQAKQFRA